MLRVRALVLAALWAIGLLCSTATAAQKLYAASVRGAAIGSDASVSGSLYLVDMTTGVATFAASVRLDGGAVGVTGLAVHPQTGVFYGATSPLSRNVPTSLVTLDPETGNAKLVGRLRHDVSDIAFSRTGILYAWLPLTSQLGVINTENGGVIPVGNANAAGPPAGLVFDAKGGARITSAGATGTLDVVDIATGVVTRGPPLTGAPFPSGINSMTFTPTGKLLAVNSNAGSPAVTRLVSIDATTGVVANIGPLPDDTDGLAFANVPAAAQAEGFTQWQKTALGGLFLTALLLALIGWFVGRKK